MRYILPPLAILPPCAIILMSSLFPNSSFALSVYIGIALYSILMTVVLLRKATPQVKQQILMAASGAVLTAVGVGVFFYLR
ncbi:MAG: hypothetical protein RIS79_4026 [Verrucomicrobiota bacterium]|jgi:hypothetical protein